MVIQYPLPFSVSKYAMVAWTMDDVNRGCVRCGCAAMTRDKRLTSAARERRLHPPDLTLELQFRQLSITTDSLTFYSSCVTLYNIMATETSQQPSHHAPLLSRIISHLRPKSKAQIQDFPIDPRPPLRPYSLPLVLSQHTPNLAFQGWTTVSFPVPSSECPSQHPVHRGFENLFESSKAFFDQPFEEKEKWKTKLGSEEGWSRVEGEKEFITIRTIEGTPEILRDAAKQCWAAAGDLMDAMLGRVSESLDMDGGEGEGGLRQFVGPCKRLGEMKRDRTPTMLRLFRYEGDESKIVAEPHSDLGLLSMVMGATPGLEVWDIPSKSWFPIEKTYQQPSASLLVGRQLERLTNFRYRAGGHQVRSYGVPTSPPPSQPSDPKKHNYRYSIVFVLRAHSPVAIDTDALTTPVTGDFHTPIKGITAGQMFEQIRGAHFNINTNLEERDKQKRLLIESRQKAAAAKGSG